MKEIFPEAELLCFFEWFYHGRGSDADFDPSEPLNADDKPELVYKIISAIGVVYPGRAKTLLVVVEPAQAKAEVPVAELSIVYDTGAAVVVVVVKPN